MGRKIPGSKHHGVKDPDKQRNKRYQIIKDKINAPPQNPDEQHVPKSLNRLIELKNRAKDVVSKRKRKKNENTKSDNVKVHNNSKPVKPIPVFEQHEGETDRMFMRRVNVICQTVQKEAAFEEKYGVEIKRNDETGEVEDVVKRPKDELELLAKKIRKEKFKKGKKKKKSDQPEEPKLTKSQKWQKKKAEKRNKKKNLAMLDNDQIIEKVNFGDIAHAPPELVVPRKAEKNQNAPRPGKKQLLLKTMLGNSSNSHEPSNVKDDNSDKKPKEKSRKVMNKVIDKTGKRKDLPNALRRQLDRQQKEVIQAYKDLKAKKYS